MSEYITELFDLLRESGPHRVMFSILVVIIIATIIIQIIEKRLKKMKKSDVDMLFDLARSRGCSEFDIFQRAADRWNFSAEKVNEDFKKYLASSDIPPYVRTYIHDEADGHERD